MAKSLPLFLFIFLLVGTGCRERISRKPPVHLNQNMDNQFKYTAQASSELFADGRAMRPQIEHTVAWGRSDRDRADFLAEDPHYYSGRASNAKDAAFASSFPAQVEVDRALLDRGQERYQIYCTPCHGEAGYGDGVVTTRGPMAPTSYHTDASRSKTDGEMFHIITNGTDNGNMGPYAHQVPVHDRWAIVAYIRALQESQNVDKAELPDDIRSKFRQ